MMIMSSDAYIAKKMFTYKVKRNNYFKIDKTIIENLLKIF